MVGPEEEEGGGEEGCCCLKALLYFPPLSLAPTLRVFMTEEGDTAAVSIMQEGPLSLDEDDVGHFLTKADLI